MRGMGRMGLDEVGGGDDEVVEQIQINARRIEIEVGGRGEM